MPIQGEGRWKLPEHKVKRAKIHQFPAKKKDGHRVLRKNHLAPRFTPRIKVPPQKAMTLEWNDQGWEKQSWGEKLRSYLSAQPRRSTRQCKCSHS